MTTVSPSLSGAVAATATTATSVLATIPVPTAEAMSEVTLAALPPPVTTEEERERELPASPGGGPHGSPARSELKAPGESVAGMESERSAAVHAREVVDIPSDDEADDAVEPPVSLRELAVV